MGTTQEKIIEALKDSDRELKALEIADIINYSTKTRMSSLLRRLRNFGLIDYKIENQTKKWFYVG